MNSMDRYSEPSQVCAPTRQTLRERLVERKATATEHLNDICKALEFLDANANFEAFHNLIGKTGF
jgi:hypothetical protein